MAAQRLSSFFLRFIAAGAAAHLYVGARLLPDLPWPPGARWGAVAYLAITCVLIPLAIMGRDRAGRPLADALTWAGMLAMGLFSSLLVLTVLRDALLLLGWVAGLAGVPWEGVPWREGSAQGVVLLTAAAGLLGLYNARRRAPLVEVEVPIDGLPPELDGVVIVQLSDLHVGPTIKRRYIRRIVDAANDAGADIIAITGDLVDGSVARLRHDLAPLGALHAPLGVYAVTGNHEYYSGAAQWVAEWRRLGLTVLMNEHVLRTHRGVPLVVAGITDYSAHVFDPAQASDPARALRGAAPDAGFTLMLAHQPRSAAAVAPLGVDLQLSGHTHGGQFFPWGLFVRLQQPFTAGLQRQARMWVYISRGTGYWGPPQRLAAPSEITRLTLRRA